jgi:hypothetical protein
LFASWARSGSIQEYGIYHYIRNHPTPKNRWDPTAPVSSPSLTQPPPLRAPCWPAASLAPMSSKIDAPPLLPSTPRNFISIQPFSWILKFPHYCRLLPAGHHRWACSDCSPSTRCSWQHSPSSPSHASSAPTPVQAPRTTMSSHWSSARPTSSTSSLSLSRAAPTSSTSTLSSDACQQEEPTPSSSSSSSSNITWCTHVWCLLKCRNREVLMLPRITPLIFH